MGGWENPGVGSSLTQEISSPDIHHTFLVDSCRHPASVPPCHATCLRGSIFSAGQPRDRGAPTLASASRKLTHRWQDFQTLGFPSDQQQDLKTSRNLQLVKVVNSGNELAGLAFPRICSARRQPSPSQRSPKFWRALPLTRNNYFKSASPSSRDNTNMAFLNKQVHEQIS